MGTLAKLALFAILVMPLQAQNVPGQQAKLAAHQRAAQEAERRNDFPTAVHEYELLNRLLPGNAEMQSNLGVALYFDRQLQRAIPVFQNAIALDPKLFSPHLFSGLAWYRLSNPGAAAPELEAAVRINPSNVLARTWLGYADVALFRYDPAAVEFEAACRLDPNNVDVWYALGQTDLQLGRQATLQLLAIAPDGGRAWQLAGEQMLLQGDRKDALKDFEGAIARRPDIPELRAAVAKLGGTVGAAPGKPSTGTEREDDLYRQARESEQAARVAFDHVVEIAPDSYRAHEIMAAADAAEQKPEKEIEEYRTVLKLEPDLPGIHEAIGNILLGDAKLPEALKEFEAELQIQPRSASVRTNAGQVMLMMGNDDGAAKMLASALQMDQPPPEIYLLLGKLDLRRKDYHSAIAMLARYVSIKRDDSTAYYLLSTAYLKVGDKEQMQRALAQFKKTSGDAKARSRAERELENFEAKNPASEQTAGLKDAVER